MSFETDASVIGRGVVSLGEGKLVGTVSALAVDTEDMCVSHYVVSSETTGADLLLPLNKAICVGDTFLTIEWRADFLPADGFEAKGILGTRFDLVGLPAYSRAGNALGEVLGYEYSTTTGEIVEMSVEGDNKFTREAYVFVSPEFAFFNAGEETDADLRGNAEEKADKPKPAAKPAPEPAAAKPAAAEEDTKAAVEEAVETAKEEKEEEAVEEAQEEIAEEDKKEEISSDDQELMKFLVGKTVKEACASEDGEFTAEVGEVLTEERVAAAQAAGALIVLAMSVD